MHYILLVFLYFITASSHACEREIVNHTFKELASENRINLCDAYQGKVLLVVNTASKCGNTPQYDGLEKLYQQYSSQGLVVLGFPSNDFFGQEPGSEKEIQEFCRLTYGVQFPMFEKIHVKGKNAHPFFTAMKDAAGRYPTWNFHKYLINRDGSTVEAIGARTQPFDEELIQRIEAALRN